MDSFGGLIHYCKTTASETCILPRPTGDDSQKGALRGGVTAAQKLFQRFRSPGNYRIQASGGVGAGMCWYAFTHHRLLGLATLLAVLNCAHQLVCRHWASRLIFQSIPVGVDG